MLRHGYVRPGEQALDRLADEPQNQQEHVGEKGT